MQRLGVKHKMTTAFHPQANGLIERFHRRLKEALKARAASADWAQHLPWVLLGLCTAPREESAVSSAELVYGAPLSLSGQFISAAAGGVCPPAAGWHALPCEHLSGRGESRSRAAGANAVEGRLRLCQVAAGGHWARSRVQRAFCCT
jgi:hypothetical protein